MPAASTVTDPPLTVAVPPVPHGEVDQFEPLSEEPVKSSLKVGMRERLPSAPTATPLCVPWANCVTPCTNCPGAEGVPTVVAVVVGDGAFVGVGVAVFVGTGVLIGVPVGVAVDPTGVLVGVGVAVPKVAVTVLTD